MALTIVLINGPRRSGKSALIELLARDGLDHAPHHIRLIPAEEQPRGTSGNGEHLSNTASSRHVPFSPEGVMDELSDALREIRSRERYATVLIEGDDGSNLRHAFPYDQRVFVMPPPTEFHAVFRRPGEAAAALQRVMDDTEAFAAEMFGLIRDETGAMSPETWAPEERRRQCRQALESEEVRRFLRTPLGAEIASRIQLQPAYQGLIESDVVAVNHTPETSPARCDDARECLRCIGTLMSRVQPIGVERSFLFCCDFLDGDDPERRRLLRRLARICDDPL